MTDSYDRLTAAREDLGLLNSDLNSVLGLLAEIATVSRRAGVKNHLGFDKRVRDSTARLATTLDALIPAGPDQEPGLAFSCVAQMSALESDVASAARTGPDTGNEELWSTITATLQRARKRLFSLLSHLVKVREWSLTGPAAPDAFGSPETFVVTFG